MKKSNDLIATKLCANLLNNRKKVELFLAHENSMTKLCRALFKCENELKIGWENKCAVLKYNQMRERVEKLDVLGWTKSYVISNIWDNIDGCVDHYICAAAL